MSADSPRRSNIRGVPAVVPPEVVSDRSIIDSVAGFINDVTLANQPIGDPKDTIIWARFESAADISDPRFGDDWELEGNVAPPLLLILGYGMGVQIWAIPANGEAVEVLSWRHGIVSALRILPKPVSGDVSRADEPIDVFSDRRPLMAICDGGQSSQGGSNPQFCSVNFLSLRTGTQVKTIKFKNPVLDILANRTSVVVTFHERIAIFDARTLEDRLTVTTCFPSPGVNPNPVALGSRWLAYSENKLLASKRSGGGCDGDGVASYTATVLNAAKSLGKGLREFTEQVTAGLTGTTGSGSTSKSASFDSSGGDIRQPGIVTILDIKYAIKDMSPTSGTPISVNGTDPIVAHFIAHSEAIVAMEFDNSGMMLLTADKRGHNFHVFRIQPHPVGSTLAAVHHLYILHRGDTSAKVQNISFSLDTRWVAVSTLRGTTHVFPITPYGGQPTARTHSNLHVVNKLSSFHHSAGLTADGRSSSPISHTDTTNFSQQLMPYFNQTMPPFPRPTFVLPLAQLRQPFTLSNNAPASAAAPKTERGNRQRLSSLSDDNGKPLSVCAVFAKSRSWLLDPPNSTRDGPSHKLQRKAVDSLFVMAGHGALIQYDLDVSYVAKDKKCDDKSIDLEVEAKAQWNLGRRDPNTEIMPPLPSDNWLVKDRMSCALVDSSLSDDHEDRNDCWLAQVEIITHAGPSRRLWMGPQFVFKTYNTPSGSSLSHIDSEAVEIGMTASSKTNQERSSPLNMPVSSGSRSTVPVLIESGSYSSIEQSPKLMDRFRHDYMDSDYSLAHGESRLKEDLADAMRESPSVAHKNTGLTPTLTQTTVLTTSQTSSESSSQSYHQIFENVVNPLGTVTTVNLLAEAEDPLADNPYVKFSPEDYVIHENCDESLFRPVVVFCDNKTDRNIDENGEYTKPPAAIENKLVVPVIDKSLHMVLTKKEAKRAEDKFDELSSINKMSKGIDIQQKDDIKSEDIQAKEEQVVTIKGKKNKKKVAEALVKESTPPRDIKKKTKQDELDKIHDNEPLKKEKISEVVVKEAVKVTESKKTLEQTKETAPKPVERKKSLEVAQSKKVSNEPTKEVPISNEEVAEVTITLKKKGKNKKESSPEVVEVLTKSEDSSSSEEHSFESVKDLSKEENTSDAKSKESSKKVRDSKVEDKKESKIDLSKSEKIKDQTENLKKEEISKDILEQSAVEDLKAEEQSKKEDSEVKIDKLKSSKEDTKDLEDTKSEQKSVKAEDSTTKVSEQKVSKKKTKPNSRSPSPAKEEEKEIVVEPKPEPISSKKKSKSSSRSSSPAKEVKKESIEPKSEASSSKKKSSSADKDIKQEEIKKEIEVGKDEPDSSKKTKPSSRSSSPAKEETVKEDLFLSKKNVKPSSRSSSPAKEVAKEEKETIKEELVLPKKKAKSNLRSSSPSKEETVKEEPIISKKKAKQSSRSSSPAKEETAKEDIVSSKKKTKPCSRSSSPAKEETVKEDLVSSQKKIKPSSRSSSPAKEQTVKEELVSSKKKAKASSRSSSPAKEEVKEETDKEKNAKPSSRSSSPAKEMEKEQKVSSDMKKQEAVEQTKDEIIPANKKSKSKKQSRESSPEVELPTSVEKMPPSKAEEQPTSSKKKNKNKKASRECSPEVTTSRKNSIEDSKTIAKIPDSEKEYKVNVKEISPPKDEPKITDFLKFVDHFNKSIEPEDQVYKVSVKDISPPETDHDFPSLSFSTKKSKKNKKPTTEMVLPIEKEKEPIIETLSPFQPGTLDKVVPAEEGATLINFESPEAINKINLLDFERPKGFPEKIIFAVCGQLSDPNEMVESEKEFLTSSSTASASEETTDETANTPETTKKKKTKKLVSPCNLNDDEELRPLISTTADTIEATPTPEVLYPCKYSEKDAKSSDSSSDTGGSGSYAIPEAAVVAPQPELQQQTSNQQQQHQSSSKKKMKRRKR